ncbi:hypothetical protein NEIELOOT_00705 [Neisseria elongata subsp. glycolytica ATCC 29315]|uniref:Uncharacterized protein n=1 Tax=Neisseria elongata subsp. glycolytica ATCC 29315 TaxID=546263 RepID=D4DNS1_NEIEG|nr:hypothetical protein NEIELOOT_00705 [Neisseria elongata subsp. glycolytica ATCC 29315]
MALQPVLRPSEKFQIRHVIGRMPSYATIRRFLISLFERAIP